jgi:hypothetical protein
MTLYARTIVGAGLALLLSAGASLLAHAQDVPLECKLMCPVNYGRCPDLNECLAEEKLCQLRCMETLNLPSQADVFTPPAGGYGADALSADGVMLGHGKNWDTKAGAESGAVRSCEKGGHPGCRVIASYRNRCLAVAWSKSGNMTPNGSWFVATAQVNAAAKSDAMKACAAAGFEDCFLRSFSCSGQAG